MLRCLGAEYQLTLIYLIYSLVNVWIYGIQVKIRVDCVAKVLRTVPDKEMSLFRVCHRGVLYYRKICSCSVHQYSMPLEILKQEIIVKEVGGSTKVALPNCLQPSIVS